MCTEPVTMAKSFTVQTAMQTPEFQPFLDAVKEFVQTKGAGMPSMAQNEREVSCVGVRSVGGRPGVSDTFAKTSGSAAGGTRHHVGRVAHGSADRKACRTRSPNIAEERESTDGGQLQRPVLRKEEVREN